MENIYEVCFCHELKKRGLTYLRQVVIPITYDGTHKAQLLSQMKLSGKRLGFLINFNVPVIKYSIKQMIL